MTGSQLAYHLRVNKFIDRQVFMETLALVYMYRPIDHYGYVSMAGAYLEDCRVLHQAHRITRMYSFDLDESVIPRQAVNLPYGFIQCHCHSSRVAVEQIEAIRGKLGSAESNVIIWLDYTSPKQRKSQLQEIGLLSTRLIDGDIVRVTFNANRATLGESQLHQLLTKNGSDLPPIPQWRHEKLKEQLGNSLPPERDNPVYLESEGEFCRTLCRSVKRAVVEVIHDRSALIAFPLLATVYNDQTTMATVTFIVLGKENDFEDKVRWQNWPYRPGPEWDEYLLIEVPHLSLRERYLLHNMIGPGGAIDGTVPTFISEDDLTQYRAHYLRYPTFAPIDAI